MLLTAVGLMMLYGMDASTPADGMSLAERQMLATVLAAGVAWFVGSLDYRVVGRSARAVYILTLVTLAAVLAVGTTARGTTGWIVVGPFSLQVVEFAKVGLIVFLARFIATKQSMLGPGGRLLVSLVPTGLLVGLVLLQPDFGSAMVLLAIWFGMFFVSGIPKRHLLLLAATGVAVAAAGWFALAPYQQDRIMVFLDPQRDPRGSGYNVIQSVIAVGSGGLTGQGLGRGTQTQLQFLPERQTDFIFAAIAEEMGFVGAAVAIGLFGVVLWRLWRIALAAPTNVGYLMTAGTMAMLFTEVFINIGMNMGLMPVTGIPLPLVSYGGSSLIATAMALGLALSVDRWTRRSVRGGPTVDGIGG